MVSFPFLFETFSVCMPPSSLRVVKFVRSLKSLLFCIGRTIRALAPWLTYSPFTLLFSSSFLVLFLFSTCHMFFHCCGQHSHLGMLRRQTGDTHTSHVDHSCTTAVFARSGGVVGICRSCVMVCRTCLSFGGAHVDFPLMSQAMFEFVEDS